MWSAGPTRRCTTSRRAASTSPFVAAINSPNLQNAFGILPGLVFPGGNPNQLARTIVSEDFESPYYDQLTFEVQRELARDVWRVGYVGTREATCFRRSTATRACHIRRLALIPAGE
jgi:hypothetical protein